MKKPPTHHDFRSYTPASVLVFDLVQHSTRPKPEIVTIQNIVTEVFANTIKRLHITNSQFNYTGDGYICTLAGDSSARLLDVINFSFPSLLNRLEPYSQKFRAGTDFGLVHLRSDHLTGKLEHFDQPGIHASRLEAVAKPGQILCTQTVHDIFCRHYPKMFPSKAQVLQCKDRKIIAFEIVPVDASEVVRLLSDFLFGQLRITEPFDKSRTKILVVDDDELILVAFSQQLARCLPKYQIVTAKSSEDALQKFNRDRYAAAFVDLVMPGENGMQLTEALTKIDSEIPVIMISGYSITKERVREFLSSGGLMCLQKPTSLMDLTNTLALIFLASPPLAFRSKIQLICDAPEDLLFYIQRISQSFNLILNQLPKPDDVAHGLLRHKAKHIVRDLVDSLRPGTQALDVITNASRQLQTIIKLARPVSRVKIVDFEGYLNRLIEDFSRINQKISFSISNDFPKKNLDVSSFGTITVLILCELIDNAIEAINERGSINIRVTFLDTTGLLGIEVQDDGPEIPEEILKDIFKEGQSSKGPGRGLGLYLVREAASLCHGDVTCLYDKGMVFKVSLYPFI